MSLTAVTIIVKTLVIPLKPLLPYPLKFSNKFPLITPPILLKSNFYQTIFAVDQEYYFREVYPTLLSVVEPRLLQEYFISKHNVTLTLTQSLAYYLSCINTFYYASDIFPALDSLSILQEDIPLNIYLLNYVMAIELLLPVGRNKIRNFISFGQRDLCNIRRKVWNLLLFWHIYPCAMSLAFQFFRNSFRFCCPIAKTSNT